MLGIAPESPASGARFVGQPACLPKRWIKARTTANSNNFHVQLSFSTEHKKKIRLVNKNNLFVC